MTIGRSDAAGLVIDDQFVSHMHARILRRGAYHFVEDLGSTNGTFLNDRRVERDAQLKVHDSLRIGQTTLRYEE
jgi:pSer/pThr/pTyr-binding forkhead associated (FHA) protein